MVRDPRVYPQAGEAFYSLFPFLDETLTMIRYSASSWI